MLLKITADGLRHWEHQKESHETIKLSQKMGFKSGLIIGAPGSGKTFIGFEHALQTVQSYWEEGKPAQVFVLVPTKHIREQKLNVLKSNYTPETLQKVKALKDIHPELNIFVTAVDDFDPVALKDADVIISTYQFFNLHEREIKENKLPVKYLIVDEAGFSASPSYQKVIHAFNPDYTLGLSIEDIKFEGKRAMELLEANRHLLPANRIAEIESSGIIKLSDLYQGNLLVDMSSEEHIRDFIDKKILADIRVKSIDFEVKDFATQSMSSKTEDYITVDENNERDFDTPKLYKDLNREKLNLDIYNDYVTKVPDYKKEKPTICTSLSIEHAQDLAKLFKEKGIAAEALHSKLSDKDQKDILERFERGEIKVLMTVEMLKLGYDFPEVETILQNRPIYSRHTYINAVGRIWRYFAGKDYCLIVDRTWNFERYASHNMHTVFNRQYKYSDKEGEQFFTTANKDYLEKNEINYDFRNFLPVVNKKIEFALTVNQLREWGIIGHQREAKILTDRLNKESNGANEVIINGIVFYKKDLGGLTLWTIKNLEKEKFINNFNYRLRLEDLDKNIDLPITMHNDLKKKYQKFRKRIASLATELNTESKTNNETIISKTRNGISLIFIKKMNKSLSVWTIDKSKENMLVQFLGINQLDLFDQDNDLAITSSNKELTNKYQGMFQKLTDIAIELNKNNKNKVSKSNNGVRLIFFKKWGGRKPVWTIPKNQESRLIEFFKLEQLDKFDEVTDIAVNEKSPLTKKYQGLIQKLNKLAKILFEESQKTKQNALSKTSNRITLLFIKKWRRSLPVWTISKEEENNLVKFLKAEQIPLFDKVNDIAVTSRNKEFSKKSRGLQAAFLKLAIELFDISNKSKENIIALTKNGITLSFEKKRSHNKPGWTLPKDQESLLIKFLGLE